MKSNFWIAVGAMLVPSAMVWALEAPDKWSPFLVWTPALLFAILGLFYLYIGWADIADEGELRKSERLAGEEQEKRRQEEHIRYLATLRIIAKRLGANPVITRRQTEREVERFRDEHGVEDEL